MVCVEAWCERQSRAWFSGSAVVPRQMVDVRSRRASSMLLFKVWVVPSAQLLWLVVKQGGLLLRFFGGFQAVYT